MGRSIISNAKKCYICGSTLNLEKHHCLFGTANRKKADLDGLWVWLCHDCHHGVHNQNVYAKRSLQMRAQRRWEEEKGKSTAQFIDRYGKSYL